MKFKRNFFILLLFPLNILTAQQNDTVFNSREIGPKALWQPGMETLHSIQSTCDSTKQITFGECFVRKMEESGASPEAVEFAKLTGNQGFMRDFKEAGQVDVAYVYYPFRANENQLCFLVNGKPKLIDIDDYNIISKVDLKKNRDYSAIFNEYPELTIWPGDRNGVDYPVINKAAGGGQNFIFNYRLQDRCHACKLIGFANLNFRFAKDGKFLGVSVVDVLRLKESGQELMVINAYSDPSKPIIVKKGQTFTISLESNGTTGYQWQLGKPLDEKGINLIGKFYLPSRSNLLGAGGREAWDFISTNKGSTEITLVYLRSWEKDNKPGKEVTFKIFVK
jgi:inhibitor of cysteine peptidase